MGYSGNIHRYYAFLVLTEALLWMPVWVVFFERRGLSLSQIGMLELVTILLLAAAEVPTGAIADTWGRKASMALGATLHGLALLGVLAAVLSPIFLLAYAFWGTSLSFISGASDAFAYDSLKADGRADAFAHVASRAAVLRNTAMALSGVIGGLVGAYDLRLCFVLTALACFAAAVVILTGREPPSGEVVQGVHAGYRATLAQGVRVALGRPRVRYVVLLGATVNLYVILLTMTAFQPYAKEVGLPLWTFGSVLLSVQVCGIGGAYFSPRLAAGLGRERLFVLAPLAIAGVQVLIWLGASRPAVALFAAAAALAAAVQPVLAAALNDAIPNQQRATVISLQSLLAMLGLGPVQLGLLAVGERTSIALAVGLAGLLMAALVAPVLVLLARSPAEPAAPAQAIVAEAT
jgi:MFS family permease